MPSTPLGRVHRLPTAAPHVAPRRQAGAMTTRFPRPPSPLHRISGPDELLQAVPYLLGFHPHDSLVLVGLTSDDPGPDPGGGRYRQLVVTARLDLDDVVGAGLLEHTLRTLRDGGTDAVVGVVYDDTAVRDPDHPGGTLAWGGLAVELGEHAETVGCALVDVLLVAQGRWWSYDCLDEVCCPSTGRTVPDTTSAFAAAATVAGVVALPSREALAAGLDPVGAEARDALLPLLERAEHAAVAAVLDGQAGRRLRAVKRQIFAAARAADEAPGEALSDEDAARFLVALGEIELRDSVWLAVDDGRLDGRVLWRDLARRAPGRYAAAALFLFGWANWRAGNGALAGIAADRAVACDPDYSAADLLLAALTQGADPRRMPRLRTGPVRPAAGSSGPRRRSGRSHATPTRRDRADGSPSSDGGPDVFRSA